MPNAAAIARDLEALFGSIHSARMADFPLNNKALQVEAVGFRDTGAGAIGVLVTPWSINLLLVPVDTADGPVGHKRLHSFPAGQFEFIVSAEEGFGNYEICSLFSPALQFADQSGARETAESVLAALFDASQRRAASRAEIAMNRVFVGDLAAAEEAVHKAEDARPRPPATPSRRDLFTGRLHPAGPQEPRS